MTLTKLLRTKEAYDILGPVGTWTAGGCWILAESLLRWLGEGEIWVVVRSYENGTFDHAVLKLCDDIFVDADGAFHKSVLLKKMALEQIPSPVLAPLTKERAEIAKDEIPCPIDKVQRLVALFERKNPTLPQIVPMGRLGKILGHQT